VRSSTDDPGWAPAEGHETEEAIRRSREHLQFVTDAVATCVAHCSADWRFLFVNKAYAARFGRRPDEVAGRTIEEVLGEAACESIRPYIERVLAGETLEHEAEVDYGGSLGRRYMHCAYTPEFDAQGRVVGWVAAVTDLTDRHRLEEEVRQLNSALQRRVEELETLIDLSPVGIAVAEDPACRTIRVNRAFREMLQLPEGANASLSAPEEERPPYRLYRDGRAIPVDELPMQHCTAHGVPVDGFELQMVPSEGPAKTLLNSVRPLFDEEGRVRGCISVCTEITALKQAEVALKEADRRKDEFLATLAHELRNPLAPIRNAVQILRMRGPQDTDLQWSRDVIERQVQQLTRLVDDLLDISRIARGKVEVRKEVVELSALLERALETSRPLIESSRHRLTVDFPPGALRLEADLVRMAQVLTNLLNNAAKYTRPGGHIQLSAGEADGQAVIRVRDDGLGIPAEKLSSIFEMFTQVDTSLERAQGGLGIGLTIARLLVEMHGGTLEAASGGPGQGSELTLRLPLAPLEDAPIRLSEQERDEPTRQASRRILVVDDNSDSADSLSFLLGLKGHDVRTAYDGPQALQAAEEHRPEVILLDIGMPGMTGYDVARRLRERPETRSALILAMTGWGQDEDRRRSQEAGFDQHLIKPLDPGKLEDLIQRLAVQGGGA
jgi:two-component system CheB/CheR fusion protein